MQLRQDIQQNCVKDQHANAFQHLINGTEYTMLSDEGGRFFFSTSSGTLPYSQTRSVPASSEDRPYFAFWSGKRNQGMTIFIKNGTPIGNVPGKKKFSIRMVCSTPKAPATGSPDKLASTRKNTHARARTFADPVEVTAAIILWAFRYLLMRSCNAFNAVSRSTAYHADRNWPCKGYRCRLKIPVEIVSRREIIAPVAHKPRQDSREPRQVLLIAEQSESANRVQTQAHPPAFLVHAGKAHRFCR